MERERALRVAQELQLQASRRLEPVLFHGESMFPFLQDRDQLWIEPIAWQDIRPGDIITYRLDDRFPTCRVAVKRQDHLLLIADNWSWARFEAWREDVLGRVVTRIRDGCTLHSTEREWKNQARRALTQYRARRVLYAVRARAARQRDQWHDRWLAWHAGYDELPSNIQVNVSSVCNLRCRMCPYLDVHTNPHVTRFMSRETFVRLLPVIRHIQAVAFVGAGEPLFNKELVQFMEMTHRAGPRARIELTTNGTLLTPEFAAHLIRLGVHKVHVSLDGLHPETVQAIRRGIPHSRVLQNIRALGELKRAQGARLPTLMINYMTGYGSYRELADFIPLAHDIGASEIQVLEMQPSTAEDYADNLFHGIERDGGRLLREAIKRAAQAGIRLHLHTVLKNACRHPYTPHIGEDGEVYPCCFLDYDGRQLYSEGKEVELPRVSFGNINHTSFRAIWNSPGYRELRRRDRVGDFPDYCRTCYNVRAETAEKLEQVLGPHYNARQ